MDDNLVLMNSPKYCNDTMIDGMDKYSWICSSNCQVSDNDDNFELVCRLYNYNWGDSDSLW